MFLQNTIIVYKKIVFYNSLVAYTDLSYFGWNKGIPISENQYVDWYKTIKNYFSYEKYDELLLVPFFTYSVIHNKCKKIFETIELFDETNEKERSLMFFEGLCELKLNSKDKLENSISKLKDALRLNIAELIPEMAEGANEAIKNIGYSKE